MSFKPEFLKHFGTPSDIGGALVAVAASKKVPGLNPWGNYYYRIDCKLFCGPPLYGLQIPGGSPDPIEKRCAQTYLQYSPSTLSMTGGITACSSPHPVNRATTLLLALKHQNKKNTKWFILGTLLQAT